MFVTRRVPDTTICSGSIPNPISYCWLALFHSYLFSLHIKIYWIQAYFLRSGRHADIVTNHPSPAPTPNLRPTPLGTRLRILQYLPPPYTTLIPPPALRTLLYQHLMPICKNIPPPQLSYSASDSSPIRTYDFPTLLRR